MLETPAASRMSAARFLPSASEMVCALGLGGQPRRIRLSHVEEELPANREVLHLSVGHDRLGFHAVEIEGAHAMAILAQDLGGFILKL